MDDHQAELDYEREVNKAYWVGLGRRKQYPVAGKSPRRSEPWGCLTARIRLEEQIGEDAEFYIGPRHLPDLQGVPVVSWAGLSPCGWWAFRGDCLGAYRSLPVMAATV